MFIRIRSRAAYAVMLILCLSTFASCAVVEDNTSNVVPKKLTIYTSARIVHDPLEAVSPEQHFFTSLENRSLFGLSPEGVLQNDLASGFEVSKDALSVTVTLNDATFSNGNTISSADVKATLKRLVSTGSAYVDLMDNVKGFGEAKGGSDLFGVETPTDKKIIFRLISPDPLFAFHLAHPATGILPATSIGLGGVLSFGPHSGLYTAGEISSDQSEPIAYRPRIESLPLLTVYQKTNETLARSPQGKDVDIILGATSQAKDFRAVDVTQLATASWNIYVKDETSPFTNVKFRQAVLMAIDEAQALEAYSTRAEKPTALAADTYDAFPCDVYCTTNAQRSKELLKEVYPDGNYPSIFIDIENNSIQTALANSAVEDLAQVGISTAIRSHSSEDYSNMIARGEVELFRFGWISEIPIAGDPLVKSFKADSTENVAGITDANLEAAIGSYLSAVTTDEKKKASRAFQEDILNLWLMRPVAHFTKTYTLANSVTKYEFDCYGRIDIGKIRVSGS